MSMRRFNLIRKEDMHDKSGVGLVAEGCEFENGAIALKWTSQYWSGTWFLNIQELKHLHGHNGKTKVSWVDKPNIDDTEEILEESI